MRLICPNCSAEYEVDASVIPPEGRDVQCSNCAHAWYEAHPDNRSDAPVARPAIPQPRRPQRRPALAEAAPMPDADNDDEGPRRSRVAQQRAERVAEASAADLMGAPGTASGGDVLPGPAPARIAPRREIDPKVLRVLRAEAEREARMRRGERIDPMEEQTELALAGEAPRQSRRIPTDPRDIPDDELVPSGTIGPRRRLGDTGMRREMLPDIEEINSTLRASTDRRASVPVFDELEHKLKRMRRGQGFRLGFSLVLLTVAFGLFAYLFAPEISARAPQAEPYLTSFVAETNRLRGWLDVQVRQIAEQIAALVAEAS